MKKIVLWVDEDEERVLEQALKEHQKKLVSAITKTDFQRQIIEVELEITTDLLHRVQNANNRVALPTITSGLEPLCNDDLKKSLRELRKSDHSAIIAYSADGKQIQASYDCKDNAFTIWVDSVLELKNQDLLIILRRFKELVAE